MKKEAFRIEYILDNISLGVLWDCLSSPSGLAGWFADDVSVKDDVYEFAWNGISQQAELLAIRANNYIRFRWIDDDEPKSYFEFKVNQDELTGDVALIVTDFACEDEKSDSIELWNNQINELKRKIGI